MVKPTSVVEHEMERLEAEVSTLREDKLALEEKVDTLQVVRSPRLLRLEALTVFD